MCLIKGLFEFIRLGVHQTFWIITVISFFKSGEISDIIFFSNIMFFLSYTPVWNFHNAYVGPLVGVLQVFKLCSLFFSLFLCCFSDLIIFTILLTSLLILFSVHKSDFESLSGFFYISHFTSSSKLLFAPLCFLPLIDISLCPYFIFLTFSMLSFSSSNVFKIVI